MLTEQEIAEIIARVGGRVEAVQGRNRAGPSLRAAAESAAFSAKLGDGIYATIDEAALEVGRDPSEIGRTTALFWQFSGGGGRRQGDTDRHTADPRTGTPEELAEALRSYELLGADHVQLVLDPITIESVEQAARALDLFRR